MKKIQLIAVNSKYMHTNLAVRALRQAVLPFETEITEITINDQLWHSAEMILRKQSDIYCFSCYIWNMTRISQLAEMIKKSQPDCWIYYGGPEVSYDASEILQREPAVDGIFCGEGEEIFRQFVQAVNADEPINTISGLQLRNHQTVIQIVSQLDDRAFPYTKKELSGLKDRILYYESMRGCPYQCAYCLSSTLSGGVRCLSLERVFSDLEQFIAADVRQVKFVDRTFNLLKPRAKAILKFLAEQDCRTNFHFEIAADLLDEEMLELIASAPKGRFQFEAGIQSTHLPTLSAVSRKTDLNRLKDRVKSLVACGNSHIHVDLIAGLPYEDFETFGHSYNEAMALRPHMLQLGFLKLLKGTEMRRKAGEYGLIYQSFPPYEVIANDFISSEELRFLKGIDHLTDLFYNSGCFKQSMHFIFEKEIFGTPFEFFEIFLNRWIEKRLDGAAHSRNSLYLILHQFLSENGNLSPVLESCVVYDALTSGCKTPPFHFEGWITGEKAFELVKNEALIADCFSELLHEAPKQRVKKLRICCFSPDFAAWMGETGEIVFFDDKRSVFTHS